MYFKTRYVSLLAESNGRRELGGRMWGEVQDRAGKKLRAVLSKGVNDTVSSFAHCVVVLRA